MIGCSQKTKYFEFDNDIGMITSYTGDSEDIVIPSEIDGVEVTKIGDYAFDIYNFTSVEIPDSVTEIGKHAFGSNELETVEIGDSVTEIGERAFVGNNLTEIKFTEFSQESLSLELGWG